MPDQIGSNAGVIGTILKWLSGALAVLVGIIWKKNESRFKSVEESVKLKANKTWVEEIDAAQDNVKKDFTDHLLENQKQLERFVTHEYLEKEIKPWIESIETRIGVTLDKLDLKIEKITDATNDIIHRPEYKSEIGVLYQKLEGKMDKPKDC
jgi:hypothetical protein